MARRRLLLRQIIGLMTVLVVVSFLLTPPVQLFLKLPDQIKVGIGEPVQILPQKSSNWLEKVVFNIKNPENTGSKGLLFLNGSMVEDSYQLRQGNPVALKPGSINLELKLYGVIPLKRMMVTVANPAYVVPGGQSIGIMVSDSGIMVKDYSNVVNSAGSSECPAKLGGIKPGDIIIQADGVKISNEWELAEIIDQTGREKRKIELVVEREGKRFEVKVAPSYCQQNRRYRIGLLVKDNLAGVGTLTFYDPQSQAYGALGHMILDGETNKKQDIKSGKLIPAIIEGIEPGQKGRPGEKIGIFQKETGSLGTIDFNNQFGIYGRMIKTVSNPLYPNPIPVAWINQIHEGPATMLTVINGEDIEEFNISVEKVFDDQAEGKGIIVRVTDPRLLVLTGGIIQGMSGSPVIQDGRLVGAITHVFINDPTRGYALSAEYMVEFLKQVHYSEGFIPPFFIMRLKNKAYIL